MTRWTTAALLLGAMICIPGCKKAEETPPPAPPSPATVDAGPAPEGQTEPATEESKPAATTPPADAAPPQSLLPGPAELQPVAFYAADAVEVEITDWAGVQKWIASQKGKVVVVDMWSLSCEPCRREFPNLVKLHNEKGDKVACLSVSTDYAGIKSKPPKFYEPRVLEFLTSQKATCKNVLCSVESEELFETLDLASIPAVYVYGKDGRQAKRFAGEEVHYDKEVLPLVDELLKK
ncbi:thiol-disulfide oxidoreductase [Caulifigura coniformis]|uniref:Thiol-disulfide oxidoreductase n=1 Tax=Caulifigura coniformis TaxID=2527983 RepID=A0A517S9V6_9PLAN|nr:TlpA disulfide reductase family protein [Caulifigura coniformis]QDT52891.1 thiol-disulfide oxidoreductase [Caulifigura coniformis]